MHCPNKVDMLRKLLTVAPEALVNCKLWSRATDVVAEGPQKPSDMQSLCATCGEQFGTHAGFVCPPPAVQPLRDWGDVLRPSCEGHVWLNSKTVASKEQAVGTLGTSWSAGRILQHLGESLYAVEYAEGEHAPEDTQIVNLTTWTLGVQAEEYRGQDIFTPLHVLCHTDIANAVQSALGMSLSHAVATQWPSDKFHATSLAQVYRQIQHLHVMPPVDASNLRDTATARTLPLAPGQLCDHMMSMEALTPLLDMQLASSSLGEHTAAGAQREKKAARRAAAASQDHSDPAAAQSRAMVQYIASVASMLRQALQVHGGDEGGSGTKGWIGRSATAELQRQLAVPVLQTLATYLRNDAVRQLLVMLPVSDVSPGAATADTVDALLQDVLAALAAFSQAETPTPPPHAEASDKAVEEPCSPSLLQLQRSLSGVAASDTSSSAGGRSPQARTRSRLTPNTGAGSLYMANAGGLGGTRTHYLDAQTEGAGALCTPVHSAKAAGEDVLTAVASLGINVPPGTSPMLQRALEGAAALGGDAGSTSALVGRMCSEAVVAGLNKLQHCLQPRSTASDSAVSPLMDVVQVLPNYEQAAGLMLLGPPGLTEGGTAVDSPMVSALQAALAVYKAREVLQTACWALAGSVAEEEVVAQDEARRAQVEYRSAQAILLLTMTDTCRGNVHRALKALAGDKKGLRDLAAAQQVVAVDAGDAAGSSDQLVMIVERSPSDELVRIGRLPELNEAAWPSIVHLPGLLQRLAGPVAPTAETIIRSATGQYAPQEVNFAVGDAVRVKLSVTKPKHGWGSVKPGDIGHVTSLEGDEKLRVNFPNSSKWSAHAPEMELADQVEAVLPAPAIQQLLQVPREEKLCVIEAVKCWADRQLQHLAALIPNLDQQLGGPLAAAARETLKLDEEIKVGAYVRVKPSVTEPGLGWGAVTHTVTVKVATYSSEAMVAICDVPSSDEEQWNCFAADLHVVPGPSELWAVARAHAAFHGADTDGAATSPTDVEQPTTESSIGAMEALWFDRDPLVRQPAEEMADHTSGAIAAAADAADVAVSEPGTGMSETLDAYANFGDAVALDPLTPERIAEIRQSVTAGNVLADTGKQLLLPPYIINTLPSPTANSIISIVHLPFIQLMLHGSKASAARNAITRALRPLASGDNIVYLTDADKLQKGAVIESSASSVTLLDSESNVLHLHQTRVLRELSHDNTFAILKAFSDWRVHSRKASRLLHSLSTSLPKSSSSDQVLASSEPRSLWEVLGVAQLGNAASAQHASVSKSAVAVVDLAVVSMLDLAEHAQWLSSQLSECADGSPPSSPATERLLRHVTGTCKPASEALQQLVHAASQALLPHSMLDDSALPRLVQACNAALPVVHGAMAVRCLQIMRARSNTVGALYTQSSLDAAAWQLSRGVGNLIGCVPAALSFLASRSAGSQLAAASLPTHGSAINIASGAGGSPASEPLLPPNSAAAYSHLYAALVLRSVLASTSLGGCGLRRVLVGPPVMGSISWNKPDTMHSHVRSGKGTNSVVVLRQNADGTACEEKTVAATAGSGWTSGVHEWTTIVANSEFGTSTEVGICDEDCQLTSDSFEHLLGGDSAAGCAWVLTGGDRQGLFHRDAQLLQGVPDMPGFAAASTGSSSSLLGTGLSAGSALLWKLDCDSKSIELRLCGESSAATSSLVAKWSIAGAWNETSRLFPCTASTRVNVQVEILPRESQRVMLWSDYQEELHAAQEAAIESERQLLKEIGAGLGSVAVEDKYGDGSAGADPAFSLQAAPGAASKEVPSMNTSESMDTLDRVQAETVHRVRDIGMGGFGVVSLVTCDVYPGMQFACKQLQSGISFEQTAELQAINAIQRKSRHPNIVWVQSLVQTGERCTGLLMGYAAGGCLTKALFPEGTHVPAPIARAGQPGAFQDLPTLQKRMQWGVQIASALAHLHELHVWHRDFKPDNVLLTSSNWREADAKLADFGQSKLTHGGATQNTRTTTTFLYFPPEAMQDKWNAASDVYQLGLTLFQVLTGNVLWSKLKSSSNLQAVLMHLLCVDTSTKICDTVGEWPSMIPEEASALVKACMERHYADRPTARQVAVGLNTAMAALSAARVGDDA